jgi:hypothetical protein
MKHIHFVIYRLKSNIHSKIKFIKPSNHQTMLESNRRQSHSPKMDMLVQYSLTKWLTQGLWGCLFFFKKIFIFIYSFLLGKCYAFPQIIVIILVWEIYFFYFNHFIFLLFNNLMRNRHCVWIETRDPQRWLVRQS